MFSKRMLWLALNIDVALINIFLIKNQNSHFLRKAKEKLSADPKLFPALNLQTKFDEFCPFPSCFIQTETWPKGWIRMATSESGINRQKSSRKYWPFFPRLFLKLPKVKWLRFTIKERLHFAAWIYWKSYWGKIAIERIETKFNLPEHRASLDVSEKQMGRKLVGQNESSHKWKSG